MVSGAHPRAGEAGVLPATNDTSLEALEVLEALETLEALEALKVVEALR